MTTEQDAELARRRRTSRHLLLSVIAVALFGCAFLALYLTRGGDDPDPQPTPSPSPSPSPVVGPRTLLIQATTADGAVGNLLTAIGAPKPGPTLIELPADLVVSTTGADPESIRLTVSSLDTLRAPAAVAATLGVRVDAAWRLDRKALAGLVDSVGGVTVAPSAAIRLRDETGAVVFSLPSGTQTLTGAEASWYAVGRVRGQTDSQSAARFEEVLQKTLVGLPPDDLAVRESLTALGALAPSTIGTQDLATFLVALGSGMRTQQLTVFELPTTPTTIADTTYRWTEYRTATPLLRRRLPWAQWEAGVDGPPRALVMAEPGHPGWIGSSRPAVEEAGFVFVDGRGTPVEAGEPSSIQVTGSRQWGLDLAGRLGLPPRAVDYVSRPGAAQPPWADVDVALGRDYVPGRGR